MKQSKNQCNIDFIVRVKTKGFQGSVRGSLLFNIYILFDLFYLSECTEICGFADDTTFYACDRELRSLSDRYETDSFLVIEWFENIL